MQIEVKLATAEVDVANAQTRAAQLDVKVQEKKLKEAQATCEAPDHPNCDHNHDLIIVILEALPDVNDPGVNHDDVTLKAVLHEVL